MKKIGILMLIGIVQFSMAGSSLIQIIEADKECKSALSKDYRTASTRELQCKTVHALAQKLKAHPSHRDFERIKTLKDIQEKLKMMNNTKKINWVLKDKEIKKNIKKLQSLIWPIGELCYFDVEVNGDKISFISAINKDNTIQLKTQSYKLNDLEEVGKSVEICTADDTCTPINSNKIILKDYNYNSLKIKTSNGTWNYIILTKREYLARIAYEVYAQLYNKNLPSLSKINIKIEKTKPKVKNQPMEVTVDE